MKVEFNHNADRLNDGIGVENPEMIFDSVKNWISGSNPSRVVEMILNHLVLTDAEKVYALIVVGQLMSINSVLSEMLNAD